MCTLLEYRRDVFPRKQKSSSAWQTQFWDIRANTINSIIAGSETTATILTGAIFLLMKNPACLERLKKEVRSTFTSEDEITFSAVEHLDYMLACLKEALRFYPPVAGELPRVVPKGGAHIAGGFVPEGTVVSISQYAINHVERNFSEPSVFNPDRFLEPQKYPNDMLDALQPFSAGPRNCIGKNLAYAEMRTIMARLIYNFDMELVDPTEDWMDQNVFFLWTKPPLNVYLTPVQR
ncbi:cytochrome P450 ClCP1 [Coniella lustricola]|uniref:Cytochrome P450 ClCP1 n=1 Tax=Coniella lustricola TaxID=2025994 RepID=A0A2T3A885_9PEZI|nr:cytochrome P450 ClCP1 [Coniella lustricola]